MEEPSVLDYLKSKLPFWQGEKIEIPPVLEPISEEEAGEPGVEQEAALLSAGDAPAGDVPEQPAPDETGAGILVPAGTPVLQPLAAEQAAVRPEPGRFPLLVLLCLGLAVAAQFMLEPSDRKLPIALALYGFAALVLGWNWWRKQVELAPQRPGDLAADPLTLRKNWVWLSLPLLTLSFFLFFDNKFNALNLALWGGGFYLFWQSFYLRANPNRPGMIERWKTFFKRGWNLRIDGWTLLVVLVITLVAFFRFYQLNSLPGDMVSDHAEKLLDIYDVSQGEYSIFFPRNTGREAFQFYWTLLISQVFGTGITFLSLKLGTVLTGLVVLYYIYRLGDEVGNRWVGLLALLLAGVAYWPNIISRIGLRFPLYPLFTAPVLYHLVRGLRRGERNQFLFAGLWLGVGLHGYTAFRIVPLLVVLMVALYLLHTRVKEARWRSMIGLGLIVLTSFILFLPLMRYALTDPEMFVYRSLTRMGDWERPLPAPGWQIFFNNLWRAVTMFFWNDGDVWVHSIPGRPALDYITGGLFFLGLVLVILRYIRQRNWLDGSLILSIPVLMLPSILSLAFPNENPNLNRTAGAYIPVFIITAMGLEALLRAIRKQAGSNGPVLAGAVGLVLCLLMAAENYNLTFDKYATLYRQSAWNTTEMGQVIRDFEASVGSEGNAYVVAKPYWVDTRLVGMNAGHLTLDTSIHPDQIAEIPDSPEPKLFIVHPEDTRSLDILQDKYPDGRYRLRPSTSERKSFLIFMVPAQDNLLPAAN